MVQERYSIGDVEGLTGISRRTLHFYVQIGLVPRPRGGGRGHYYTEEHLQRLSLVKDLQSRGLSLREIGQHLSATNAAPPPAQQRGNHPQQSRPPVKQVIPGSGEPRAAAPWMHVHIDDGVELHLRGRIRELPPACIEKVRLAVMQALGIADEQFPSDRKEHAHGHDPEEA